jgi:hypothetical protein
MPIWEKKNRDGSYFVRERKRGTGATYFRVDQKKDRSQLPTISVEKIGSLPISRKEIRSGAVYLQELRDASPFSNFVEALR